MYIKKISISNYRVLGRDSDFSIDEINVPDGISEGSGITVFAGENGCGKTTLLDAFALSLLEYKKDMFSINDINEPSKKTVIQLFSDNNFAVDGTFPKSSFQAKGFIFEGTIRSRANSAFLSSMVVSDRRYIRADGILKPPDGSPDLRLNVDNPFKGKRFDENNIVFLDNNRTNQTHLGTYNQTKFDRLMEDFNYQYIQAEKPTPDLTVDLEKVKSKVNNDFMAKAINKFTEISNVKIDLNIIDNWKPFASAFLANKKSNNQQIPIHMLGSGYEIIFSLLYAFYLSQQSKKQLIAFIDEPELHLHPLLQKAFVQILLEFSKNAQIILTTHSPLLIKQLLYNDNVKANILTKGIDSIHVVSIGERLLPYNSSNEINYLAFGLPSEEYHNELYEELKYIYGEKDPIKDFDMKFFILEKKEAQDSPWKGYDNEVSIHTYIRNQIHHQKSNGKPDEVKLDYSISKMRKFIKEYNKI